MERILDVRGLSCPLPLIRARAALADLPDRAALVVLATDPEAPVDLGALAVDRDLACDVAREGPGWRITLIRRR